MMRRRFIGGLGLLGANSFISAGASKDHDHLHTGEQKSVTYAVKGFSCITCAVGLETLLRRQKGVLAAGVDYASATAIIGYDPDVLDGARLQAFIVDAGFTATRVSG